MFENRLNATMAFYIVLLAGVGATFYLANLPIIERSVWVDEAMLISNYWRDSSFRFFRPLPYYDQAAPPLPSMLLNLAVKQFDNNIIAVRMTIMASLLLSIAYLLINAARYRGVATATAIAVLCCGAWQLVYFSTELKHYGFEIAGCSLMTGWFIGYCNRSDSAMTWRDALLLLVALTLGFSTLFPFLCLVLILFTTLLIRGRLEAKSLLIILLLSLCSVCYKLAIDYYSQFQLQANFDVYKTEIALRNLKRLFRISDALVIIAAVLASLYLLAAVLKAPRQAVRKIINDSDSLLLLFGLGTLAMVGLAGLLGLYPAIAHRQMVWLLPPAIAMLAVITLGNHQQKKPLRYGLIVLFLLISSGNIAHLLTRFQAFEQRTANQQLYSRLSQLDAARVLLHFGAQPSFDIYKHIYPELARHQYFGRFNRDNGPLIERVDFYAGYADYIQATPGAYSSMVYFRQEKNYDTYSDWAVRQTLEADHFYVVLSHYKDYIRHSFVDALARRDCRLTTIFSATQVELMEANCNV